MDNHRGLAEDSLPAAADHNHHKTVAVGPLAAVRKDAAVGDAEDHNPHRAADKGVVAAVRTSVMAQKAEDRPSPLPGTGNSDK